MSKDKGTIGSSFDHFLEEEGIKDDVHAAALKRALAHQIEQAMAARGITKTAMAKQMETSRSQLDRLLDPDNDAITLRTLQQAARAVGRSLKIELV